MNQLLASHDRSHYHPVVNENVQDLFKWAAFIIIFGLAVWLQRKFFGRGKDK